MKNEFAVPVLYLAFNRLESVKKTFLEIQKIRPQELFISCDGPRTKEEKNKTDAVREYILNNINWKCKIKTLFRNKNLGCKLAVSGAIDWFFGNVEEGIILEDDCLPNQSFFRFCQEMLEKYRDEDKIMSVSGYNYLDGLDINESYYFSRYFECWGWATWKKAWKKCDIEMKDYKSDKKSGNLSRIMPWIAERIIYKKRFEDNLSGKLDSWAYCFLYSHLREDRLSIVPKYSLVKNMGICGDSTHTSESAVDKKYFNTKVVTARFPLWHPTVISSNRNFDKKYIRKEIKRILLKLI